MFRGREQIQQILSKPQAESKTESFYYSMIWLALPGEPEQSGGADMCLPKCLRRSEFPFKNQVIRHHDIGWRRHASSACLRGA
jgi:hypothetical protein